MMTMRFSGALAPWTGGMLASLLLCGCDAAPSAPSAALERGATATLQRCEAPELLSLAPTSHPMVVPAAYPQQPELARLPRVGQFLPLRASESPLGTRRPVTVFLGVKSLPESDIVAPLLIGPGDADAPREAGPVARIADAANAAPTLAPASGPPSGDAAAVEPVSPPAATEPPALTAPPALRSPATEITAAQEPTLAPPAGPALTASDPPDDVRPEIASRSLEMEAVASQAERHIQRGYELAGRGALYSARAEFVLAMRTLSLALDLSEGDSRHSQALADGLRALDEAEDFVPAGTRLEADLDLAHLVSAHRTPVLKEEADLKSLSPLVALQRYYTYSQEQLGMACGHEEAGSMALYGLGRLYGAMAANRSARVVAAVPKSMVFLQAAITTSPGNYLAANELAVCLARNQRYEQARELLQHCVALSPQPVAWRNLAMVHRQLGEVRLAEQAERRSQAATRTAGRDADQNSQAAMPVRWLAPSQFASTTRPTDELQSPTAPPPATSRKAPESQGGAFSWLPWSAARNRSGSDRR